ncbi:hypothetical protein [Natrinema gelatinilyticum]|uniref:hypothetical protein n=1 Tax=Natrinema gelatinilyticum TaxID=2961571 RepID=UPI0020C383B0|nr:hypothetical protein [Natrinema gelatinilyticum]
MNDEDDAVIIKGKIFDNMQTIEEYTTSSLARKVGMTKEEIEPYLQELAEDGRIRKRERNDQTKWVRFG